MTDDEMFVAFGSANRNVRPSNWIQRLLGIAAAHWQDKTRPVPCATCAACHDSTCFVFPVSLQTDHPELFRDLRFCLRMLEVPEVTARCPRSALGAHNVAA